MYLCIFFEQKSETITQVFTEFFITFGKPHHPAFKDSLARWMKEVIGSSDIDIEIFKPHSTRVQVHSLHTILEKSRTRLLA